LKKVLTHGSLFSGQGGFDLAAEWMKWENKFHCEINPFGQKILKYYWPKSKSYADIKTTDFTIFRGHIDVLTGGFPCQPYSTNGLRKGKEDERHLWPEMLRAIREIQPPWIVGENVRGLTNWNGGMVFDEVQSDLEALGYEVTPFLLPACAVNAPHRRDRIWFIAYSSVFRCNRDNAKGEALQRKKQTRRKIGASDRQEWVNSNTENRNDRGHIISQDQRQASEFRGSSFKEPIDRWANFPNQSPICDGNDGLSGQLDSTSFSKWRTDSIKSGGNAIVPQVALNIFRAIEKYELTN
jgi:DNA (cytosine-5)-methyltransferase 1